MWKFHYHAFGALSVWVSGGCKVHLVVFSFFFFSSSVQWRRWRRPTESVKLSAQHGLKSGGISQEGVLQRFAFVVRPLLDNTGGTNLVSSPGWIWAERRKAPRSSQILRHSVEKRKGCVLFFPSYREGRHRHVRRYCWSCIRGRRRLNFEEKNTSSQKMFSKVSNNRYTMWSDAWVVRFNGFHHSCGNLGTLMRFSFWMGLWLNIRRMDLSFIAQMNGNWTY